MNIKLENIGIVKDSSIKLDGLTVITGNNNSGKTTVGKVIYSLIDAVSNLSSKSQKIELFTLIMCLVKCRKRLRCSECLEELTTN